MTASFFKEKPVQGQDTASKTAALSLSERRITVLLIDDQAVIAEAIRRMLATEEDITFYYCSEPAQAIPMAMEIEPTVILQDLVMPDIDGLLLLRFFRANPETRDIPMMVLSNKDEPNIKAEAFNFGANDYLVKLPDKIELVARIRYHSKAYINLLQRNEAYQAMQQTQAQLFQAEKMSSLAQLVAGVAHEINNPINFIYGNLDHVNDYIESLLKLINLYQQNKISHKPEIEEFIKDVDLEFLIEDLPKVLSSMKVGADRIRQIILTLRNFSRLDEAEMKPVNIHEGIESTLLILQHRLKAKADRPAIQIIKEYGNLPKVECYAGQMNQVFMNVLSNAIDALQRHERESLPEEMQSQPSAITIRTQVQGNNRVAICIKDNGVGMTSAIKAKLFDPFFTTKAVGDGTGLGLSLSYQIVVKKHNGALWCVSEPAQGAEFWIEIPCSKKVSNNEPEHQKKTPYLETSVA